MRDLEIDALVAQHIFGWLWKRNTIRRSDTPAGSLFPIGAKVLVPSDSKTGYSILIPRGTKKAPGWAYSLPSYSANMARAWEAAEHAIHEKPEAGLVQIWRCFRSGAPYGPSGYRVRLGEYTGWATEAPLAMCLAVLSAYGVVVKE